MLATAAKIDLQAKMQAYHAAVLRGDADSAETIRREAHDMLDNGLDLFAEAANAVRQTID